MTGLSNIATPSSVSRQGTLDSGLAAIRAGGDWVATVGISSICSATSRAMAQAITLRTNGLAAE